jgi:uncharacterized protein
VGEGWLRRAGRHFAVRVTRGVPVVMPDGVRLLADHYPPRGHGRAPTILIRTPYGRGGETPFGAGFSLAEFPARHLAARGYNVLVQGVRGCFASGGVFNPHEYEAADGAATAAWIARQPWHNGRLGMWGPSYLGYAQWAASAAASAAFHALVPLVTSAEPFSVAHPDGAFGLETRLRWAHGVAVMDELYRSAWRGRLRQAFGGRASFDQRAAFRHLPLLEADLVAWGRALPHYRDALLHDRPDDPFWQVRDHSASVAHTTAPAHLIGGWHDYFLRGLLRDYQALHGAGRQPRLTIGAWHHAHPGVLLSGLREGLRWFDVHLRGAVAPATPPVQLFVTGANVWRGDDAFPPPGVERRLFLREGRRLAVEMPGGEAMADRYRYDPADPTLAVGGALLSFVEAGVRDNRALEARPDVLCYTSDVLAQELEFVGGARLELWVRSSLAHTDFFGRICDVEPGGRSLNVCDGLVRLAPGAGVPGADGVLRIEIELSAAAHRFRRGHRIRLQVSSGAHPRWSRNLGTGEPVASAVRMVAADQEVYRDAARPSALLLPVVASGAVAAGGRR